MYATDRRQTKSSLNACALRGGGIITVYYILLLLHERREKVFLCKFARCYTVHWQLTLLHINSSLLLFIAPIANLVRHVLTLRVLWWIKNITIDFSFRLLTFHSVHYSSKKRWTRHDFKLADRSNKTKTSICCLGPPLPRLLSITNPNPGSNANPNPYSKDRRYDRSLPRLHCDAWKCRETLTSC